MQKRDEKKYEEKVLLTSLNYAFEFEMTIKF